MKTTILFCFSVILSCLSSFAQEPIGEPDFIGEVLMVYQDNTTKPLEKTTVQIKTKAGASVYLTGIGKVKSRINIDGCCANVRVGKDEHFKLIVRAVDNNTDPLSIISIFEMEKKGKKRRAELSSSSTFGGVSDNNLEAVQFSGKKYGENSYIITFPKKEAGEYGIIVRNPNSLDEKFTVVATFGIDE